MDKQEKFRPDVATILRETTPEKIAERRRVALAGLAAAGGDRPSAPSPWAKGGTGGVDPAALPSAAGPRGGDEAVALVVPTQKPARGEQAEAARRSWKLVLACALIAVLAPVVLVLLGRTKETVEVMPAAVTSGMAAMAMPSTQATAGPGASATATATTNPANPTAAAPSATVSAAVPAPIVGTSKPRPRALHEDPYEAATASPNPSAAPTSAPTVTAAPPAPSTATPPTKPRDPFLLEKQDQ